MNKSQVDKAYFQKLLLSSKEDTRAFAKLLTEIDNFGPSVLQYSQLLEPPDLALRIGVTGCMGVGKSALINVLVSGLISRPHTKGLKIGVLAVDPTSPICRGAILGDRIRLSRLSSGFFFRSIGSRGSLGGVCAKAYLMLRAFDWAEFDMVFVETVGVGQTEWEVMHVADIVALVLTPENGDGVQLMKSGLMEIADVFIVNKADRLGADILKKELLIQMQQVSEEIRPPVFSTIAKDNQFIEPLCDYFLDFKQQNLFQKKRWSQDKLQAEAKALMRLKHEEAFMQPVLEIKTCRDLQKLVV